MQKFYVLRRYSRWRNWVKKSVFQNEIQMVRVTHAKNSHFLIATQVK